MNQLSQREWRELDRLVLELHQIDDAASFEQFVLEKMLDALGAEFASWNEHDSTMTLKRVVNSSPYENRVGPYLPALNRTIPTHPLLSRFIDLTTGKVRFMDTVERTRQKISAEEYHSLPFYQEVAQHFGVEDQLLLHVSIHQTGGVLLTFHGLREFTEAEVLKACILRGHILARFHVLQQGVEREQKRVSKVRLELQTILSVREFEVLQLLCTGISNGEIALQLGIAKRTVDNHVSHLLQKLGKASRAHVIAQYAGWLRAAGSFPPSLKNEY